MAQNEKVKKAQALRMAKEMGCSGAHKDSKGNWLPCSSREEMITRSNIAETEKWRQVVPRVQKSDSVAVVNKKRVKGRRKKRRDEWEELGEKPIGGIEHIEGAGLVSANLFAGKSDNNQIEVKKAVGPEYVRETDPDVFLDPDSARERAKRLGCIGISRRMSKNGRAVWMPCTNMSDYSNRTGATSLGRRNMERSRKRDIERAVRVVLSSPGKLKGRGKKSLARELLPSDL